MTLNRRDYYSAIPQLEAKLSNLSKYITVEEGKIQIKIDDVYDKTSSLIEQTAGEIRLEVAQKVDEDEIISKINMSPESILISASRVNIEGAAIFNSYLTKAEAASTYATESEASEDTQRIYYKKSAASAPTAPTSWITSTATQDNTWTTKRMPYDSSYKYLYTCVQQRMADGSVECTTVLLDDTTTVIDGGNIITGSITANQIASNTITTSEIAVATQNAILNSELDDDIAAAAATATYYIRNINGKGLCVCRDSTDNNNVLALTSTGVNVYSAVNNASVLMASYGASAVIGPTSGGNLCVEDGLVKFRNGTTDLAWIQSGTTSTSYPSGAMTIVTKNLHVLTSNSNTEAGYEFAPTSCVLPAKTDVYGKLSCTGAFTASGNATVDKLYVTTPGTASSSTANCRIATAEGNRIMFTGSGSTRRIKHDIKPIKEDVLDPHRLYGADVIQFIYNEGLLSKEDCRYDKPLIGFVAEDLLEVYPTAVDIEDGKVMDWNYRYLIPPMLALIQEQHAEIEELKRRLS